MVPEERSCLAPDETRGIGIPSVVTCTRPCPSLIAILLHLQRVSFLSQREAERTSQERGQPTHHRSTVTETRTAAADTRPPRRPRPPRGHRCCLQPPAPRPGIQPESERWTREQTLPPLPPSFLAMTAFEHAGHPLPLPL